MYEFPPDIQLPATFFHHQVGLAVLALGGLLIYILLNKNRRPRLYDPGLILFVTCIQTLFLRNNYGSHNHPQIPASLFEIAAWLLNIGATVASWSRLANEESRGKSVKGIVVWIFTFVFFTIPFLNIFGNGDVRSREPSQSSQCLNNMRNLGVAVHNYATDNRGDIPAAAGSDPPRSWRVEILPLIEQQRLRETYNEELAWNAGENADVARFEIEVYQCPANPIQQTPEGFQLTGYAAVTGTNAMWAKQKSVSLDDVSRGDGLSQTLMIVEDCGQNIAWSEPRDVDLDSLSIGINLPGDKKGTSNGILSSYHRSGANVIFGDGSGRRLSQEIDPVILKKLSTATGGEVLTSEDY